MIVLRAAKTEAWIVPKLGASLARLHTNGKDYLRPQGTEPSSALELAGFPMVPYCNRIENGTFRFMGKGVVLERNFGASAHPLHGHAWLNEWRVERQDERTVELVFDYQPGDWPWAYQARLLYALRPGFLSAELLVRNQSDEAMPVGLGFHPYFSCNGNYEVVGGVSEMWESNAESLPTRAVAYDKSLLHSSAAARHVDNCFGGFVGHVRLNVDGRPFVSLRASTSCQYLHLYAPRGSKFVCIEPATHAPNSLGRSEHKRYLAPRESQQIWVDIQLH